MGRMSADPGNPHDSHCGPGAAGQAELASMQKRFMAAGRRTALSGPRPGPRPDDCEHGHDHELGLGYRQRTEAG